MARVVFTATRVREFSCPPDKGQAFLWDADTRQLALRVTPAGRPAYVFQSRLRGQSIRITIGDPAIWTIPQARARARELQAMIDRGLDPRVELARQRAQDEEEQRRAVVARAPALTAWHEYCRDRRAAWGERHYLEHLRYASPGGEPKRRGRGLTAPGPLFELLDRPLARLDAAAVDRWTQANAHRPTSARLALRLLSAFLGWCRAHPQYRHIAPADNPTKGRRVREVLGPAKPKTDALQREQLAPWFAAVRQQHPVIAAYLQALLLTGARPGELRGLRWEDVDFQWRTLTIRDKIEGERAIPLTPYVAHLLQWMPRRGGYVFQSERADGPIAPPNHQALRACHIAGVPPVTLHGLRRSFGTLAEWVEAPVGVVAQIMGHKPSATAERHYRVRPIDLLRLWHTRIEAWILEQAGMTVPTEETKTELTKNGVTGVTVLQTT